jgi:dihydrofolate reductase
MRKLIVFNRISLDGYFSGLKGEIDWFLHDPEVDRAAHGMMTPDTVLFGRITYQMFESYWPQVEADPNANKGDRALSNELNQMTKVVFSKTLTEVPWKNSRLVKGNMIQEAGKLKQGDGPDMVIFGSGSIVQQLAKSGMIDEYLMVVSPVILGNGISFFTNISKFNLHLLKAMDFSSGNVLLHYRVAKG